MCIKQKNRHGYFYFYVVQKNNLPTFPSEIPCCFLLCKQELKVNVKLIKKLQH